MKTFALSTLTFLGLAAAAHAQGTTIPTYKPIDPPIVRYDYGMRDLSISQVLGVSDVNSETRRVWMLTSSGASVTVEFWYPATPPQLSLRRWISPVPAVLMTRALQAVQGSPSRFTTPFTLRVWKDQYTATYSAYSGTELSLTVPAPTHMMGNSQAGGLQSLRLVAAGNLAVRNYQTWGYLRLESDSGNQRNFHIISSSNIEGGLTAINAQNAQDIASRIFGSTLFVAFVSTPQDATVAGDRLYFIANGISWY